MAFVDKDRLVRILSRVLDESEFLSQHGVRALSRYHLAHPFSLEVAGQDYSIDYEPGESTTGLYGGNSNWRGPIWFPINYLLIEALQRFHYFYGDDLKVEFPTGSGNMLTLWQVAAELSHRLIDLFALETDGRRAVFGNNPSVSNESLVARYDSVLRVLQRRHGQRTRREPSDRMDRTRCEADPATRGILGARQAPVRSELTAWQTRSN